MSISICVYIYIYACPCAIAKCQAFRVALDKQKENTHILSLHTDPTDDENLSYPKVKEYLVSFRIAINKLYKVNQEAAFFVRANKHKVKKT